MLPGAIASRMNPCRLALDASGIVCRRMRGRRYGAEDVSFFDNFIELRPGYSFRNHILSTRVYTASV